MEYNFMNTLIEALTKELVDRTVAELKPYIDAKLYDLVQEGVIAVAIDDALNSRLDTAVNDAVHEALADSRHNIEDTVQDIIENMNISLHIN